MKPPICPDCKKPAIMQTGDKVYPERPDLAEDKFWTCPPCDFRVGAHKHTGEPFGTMANAELRWQRQQAHEAFDGLWKGGLMSRDSAYKWLSKKLQVTRDNCHIGQFNMQQCRAVVHHCKGL